MASLRFTCLLLIASAQVFSTEAQCPYVHTADENVKTILSPNYPNMYSKNTVCGYKITAPSNQVVYIESIDVSLYGNDDDCGDKIEIFNGPDDSSPLKRTVCGMSMIMMASEAESLYIKFTSDMNRQGKGFALKYWAGNKFKPNCGENVNVTSPVFIKFPEGNRDECEHKLRAPTNSIIVVELAMWRMPESMACGLGSMMVSDASDPNKTMIHHCGPEQPFAYLSSKSDGLNIKLATNLTGTSQEFFIKVDIKSAQGVNCDEVSSMPIEPIPTYGWYPVLKNSSNGFCTKTLLAPGTRVQVAVVSPMCTGDTLPTLPFTMSEGGSNKQFTCMNGHAVYTSMTQDLVLTSTSNASSPALLKVVENTLCNRYNNLLATRTKKTLMTPNYPSEYPLNALCSWRFVSYRSDYVVVIEVEEADLPDNCNDIGFVNDGELETNDRLGEFCGKRKPVYRGTGQTLLVTFAADHMMTGHKGFKFTYYADNAVPREMVAGTDVATIALVFTIILVAGGIIFIVYRLFTRRKAKRIAREADRQPITQ